MLRIRKHGRGYRLRLFFWPASCQPRAGGTSPPLSGHQPLRDSPRYVLRTRNGQAPLGCCLLIAKTRGNKKFFLSAVRVVLSFGKSRCKRVELTKQFAFPKHLLPNESILTLLSLISYRFHEIDCRPFDKQRKRPRGGAGLLDKKKFENQTSVSSFRDN